MIEIAFWICVAFVGYAYLGYPAAIGLIARLRPRPIAARDVLPSVSFIITVHNEQSRVEGKILNTLATDYPRERLEIVVASDQSTDATHEIVRRYAPQAVRLVIASERRGKEFAQGEAIRATGGAIIVFSDVATRLDPSGIRAIVAPFADPSVGCVSSVDRMIDEDGHVTGEGAYVRYEMWLRSLESAAGTLIGLSGSFFAARREVCQPWAVSVPSDFVTLLNALRLGLRGVSAGTAFGYYQNIADESREYGRKVRTVVRGLAGLFAHLELLNPWRHGLAAWQLFSHKLCRWLVPFALIGALALNLVLALEPGLYRALAVLQVAAYGVAASGIPRRAQLSGCRRLVTFLLLVNLSILNAWYDFVRGRRIVVWEPSKR